MPQVLPVGVRPFDPELLSRASGHLRGGGLLAMPTETVYGFSCLPEGDPLRTLMRLKQRGPDQPFLLLVPSAEAVSDLRWPPDARRLAGAFWPGALTLILEDVRGRFPTGVRSPEGGVAVRVSPHPVVRDLMGVFAGPLVSTSANAPGGAPALSASEALEAASALGVGDDLWVLDGGRLEPSRPSTILDCTGPAPIVRRTGAVPVDRLRQVVPGICGVN